MNKLPKVKQANKLADKFMKPMQKKSNLGKSDKALCHHPIRFLLFVPSYFILLSLMAFAPTIL